MYVQSRGATGKGLVTAYQEQPWDDGKIMSLLHAAMQRKPCLAGFGSSGRLWTVMLRAQRRLQQTQAATHSGRLS